MHIAPLSSYKFCNSLNVQKKKDKWFFHFLFIVFFPTQHPLLWIALFFFFWLILLQFQGIFVRIYPNWQTNCAFLKEIVDLWYTKLYWFLFMFIYLRGTTWPNFLFFVCWLVPLGLIIMWLNKLEYPQFGRLFGSHESFLPKSLLSQLGLCVKRRINREMVHTR